MSNNAELAKKRAPTAAKIKKRGPCKFAGIQPDRAGKIVMRSFSVWPCSAPLPELPALPASITNSYGYTWPPRRTYVDREACAECPCWAAREEKEVGLG
ncbi:hypothetical protein NKJ23_15985 [Mesorhizobium sp. M0184]|uniref:hypothetical protein n=1 Tax=Mesorhizobium sp. M0184 TaxID=2956906 RepID=UPI0033369E2A